MGIKTEIIIYIIKTILMNLYILYAYKKILAIKHITVKQNVVIFIFNLLFTALSAYIEFCVNSFLSGIILCLMYGIVLGNVTKTKLGHALVITLLSYLLCAVCLVISATLSFALENIISSYYLKMAIITMVQFILLYGFFKIKRFKNGFSFLNGKLNNEIADILIVNICTMAILIYCLFGTYYDEMAWSLIITFVVLSIVMFLSIQKMFTMYYKQKLLTDTMEEYKKELEEKQNEIKILKSDKKNISKITHEFYNRQKALELLVTSNMDVNNIDKKNVSQNVINIIEQLTNEYTERFEQIKELPKLPSAEIQEIDNMFKYMQSECHKNNIKFKLNIMGNIHYLVNNLIDKNKLETLIGDHIRDAINAVNLTATDAKEIFVILGVNKKKYELSVYDTGVDFNVNTLIKLGKEAVTTNESVGGTGTGFMTTFETLSQTKASLVITEFPKTNNMHYTKCVSIQFDGKNQYRICSYRAEEIKQSCKDNRIKIETYKQNGIKQ